MYVYIMYQKQYKKVLYTYKTFITGQHAVDNYVNILKFWF